MFRVSVVKSGKRFGLLLERQPEPSARIERGYFYFSTDSERGDGLPENEQVLRACGQEGVHGLHASEHEARIMVLLKNCAELFDGLDVLPERVLEAKVAPEGPEFTRYAQRGLSGEGRRSALADFLRDYDTFKAEVLDKDWGTESLIVNASHFDVLYPHEVMPDEELDYLRHARHVLKVGEVEQEKWFRRQGPWAIDFGKDVVYRRKDRLEQLRKLLFDHPVSILEGKSATGKTVLVRNLLYDLLREDHLRLYHFAYKPFDVEKLAREVNSIRGVVVLEDIHRDMLTFQRLYSLLRGHPQRHVLFTARSHFRTLELQAIGKLGQLPSLHLLPFENVDKLIKHYCSQHPEVEWHTAVLQSVKEFAKESFWLLAYALEGCKKKAGAGSPKEWIVAGAKQSLGDIETLGREEVGRELAAHLPQILVALSPLYLSEVCTAEIFLVNDLGLELAAISALADMGEITREETLEGDVLYGLPHSGLAAAYWEHGTTYRKRLGIPDQEDFLYKYAVANTPNGLTAVTSAGREVGRRVVERLSDHRMLAGVLAREKSFVIVVSCCASLYRISGNDDEVLKAVAARIIAAPIDRWTGLTIGFCIEEDRAAWDRLWQFPELERLAKELCTVAPLSDVGSYLAHICVGSGSRTPGRDLCRRFNVRLLACRILEVEDLRMITGLVRIVWQCDPPTGSALWHMVRKRFTELVIGATDYSTVAHFVHFAADIDRAFGRKVLSHVQLAVLAKHLDREGSVFAIVSDLLATYRLSQARGKQLWRLLDRRRLAAMFCSPDRSDSDWDIGCVQDIYKMSRAAGRELWKMIQEAGLVEIVDRTSDVRILTNWISRLGTVDPRAARSLWAQVNRSAFASKVSALPEARSINSCISKLYSADREIASELCADLRLEDVAETYVSDNTCMGPSIYARVVDYANGEVGCKLWELMMRRAREMGIELIRLGRRGDH